MHQRAEHYRGQFEPWDPCYCMKVVASDIDHLVALHRMHGRKGGLSLSGAAVRTLKDNAIKSSFYVNAVIMGLGQD